MRRHHLTRALVVPVAVQLRVRRHHLESSVSGRPPLAPQRESGEALPGDDVREGVLHGPGLTFEALERGPAENRRREPAHRAIEPRYSRWTRAITSAFFRAAAWGIGAEASSVADHGMFDTIRVVKYESSHSVSRLARLRTPKSCVR